MPYKDPEKARKYAREAARRRRAENPEKYRAYWRSYRAKNIEKAREATRRWQKNNPEKIRDYGYHYRRRWRAENPEENRDRKRRDYAKHAEKRRESERRRYARRGGDGYRRHFEVLLKRDGPVCGICKGFFEPNDDIHVDHIRPVAKGGTSDIDNLQLSHAHCNTSKQDQWDGDNDAETPQMFLFE